MIVRPLVIFLLLMPTCAFATCDVLTSRACLEKYSKFANEYDRTHPHFIQPPAAITPPDQLRPKLDEYLAALADRNYDPAATKFRDTHIVDGCPGCTGSGAGDVAICGQIIAKNLFGAYSGWHQFYALLKPFVSSPPDIQIFTVDTSASFKDYLELVSYCQRDLTVPEKIAPQKIPAR